MKQLLLHLDNNYQRPVIKLENGLTALLDTGAYIPVWTASEKILQQKLGGCFIQSNVPLSGFGGRTYGNLYQVTLKIGELIYPNMHIVTNNELDVEFSFILSATMFNGLIYEIDTIHNTLNINIPDNESIVRNLRIKNRNGKWYVLCESDFNNKYTYV